MKLTNPTDDQLDAAFAEHVAGWFRAERMGKQVLYDPEGGHVLIGDASCMPHFTRSADAVLPWLEKMPEFEIHAAAYAPVGRRFRCTVWPHLTQTSGANDFYRAYSDSPVKAAVIALLRAHEIEIEFTR